jgi:hypothetical protein
MDTLTKLHTVIEEASAHYHTNEFTYEWEWEMFFLPSQTIYMNDEPIHMTHNIYFDFGEVELDQLVESGYLDKLEKIAQKYVIRIRYRIKD